MYTQTKDLAYANYSYDETIDFEDEWDFIIGEINEIASELNGLGWEYFSAGGYTGWNKSASNTGIYGLNGETLKEILFCYNTEMNIVIDFTNVDKGIFEVKMSHHDSPTGETVYFVRETSIDADDEWENHRQHCIDVATEKNIR